MSRIKINTVTKDPKITFHMEGEEDKMFASTKDAMAFLSRSYTFVYRHALSEQPFTYKEKKCLLRINTKPYTYAGEKYSTMKEIIDKYNFKQYETVIVKIDPATVVPKVVKEEEEKTDL